jgi:hypothetical protein
MSEFKFALVVANTAREVWAYLPDNYAVLSFGILDDERNRSEYLIGGVDVAGWTMDEYVVPRFQSGSYQCVPVSGKVAVEFFRDQRK